MRQGQWRRSTPWTSGTLEETHSLDARPAAPGPEENTPILTEDL